MKNIKILAIETSCDETAAAVILAKKKEDSYDLEILSNVVASQIDLHQKFGGVYPELASRAHAEKIIPVIEEALVLSKSEGGSCENMTDLIKSGMTYEKEIPENKKVNPKNKSFDKLRMTEAMEDIDAIAVTYGPGLVGSLVVGLAAAKTLAYVFNKPILPTNHWEGHIYANFVSKCANSGRLFTKNPPSFPSLILTVSGGHTNIILMKNHGEYEILGQTMDDAAGEAFDKVARLLGLGYPGGPAISAKAEEYKLRKETLEQVRDDILSDLKLPRPMLHSGDFNFSFSGLKTAVLYKVREIGELSEDQKIRLANEFQEAITDTLITKMKQAIEKYQPKSICLAGGVSANKVLREKFTELGEKIDYHPEILIPPFELTTDNAAMIGAAGIYNYISGKSKTWYDVSVDSGAKL